MSELLLDCLMPVRIVSKKNYKATSQTTGRYFNQNSDLEQAIAQYALATRTRSGWWAGPVKIEVVGHFRDKRHSDCQSLAESVCDALQGVIYQDDRQVVDSRCLVCECGEDKLRVRVWTTERNGNGECMEAA